MGNSLWQKKAKLKNLVRKNIVLIESDKELTEQMQSLQDRLDKRITSENTTIIISFTYWKTSPHQVLPPS